MKTTYWDIETKPLPQKVEDYLKPYGDFREQDVALGNRKDPDKIRQCIEDARAKHRKAARKYVEDAKEKAALNPQTAQIITIQYAQDSDDVTVLVGDEEDILRDWWDIVRNDSGMLVNWAGNHSSGNFDWNFVLRRSWAMSIATPFFDRTLIKNATKSFLEFADWNTYMKLELAAKELGIPVKDTQGVEGKNFWQFLESDPEKAMVYAEQDVILTREIWRRMRAWE